MKISLVIRTLNEEKNIGKCLTAVLSQTKLPDEILLVDNNSTDKTVALASEFQDRLNLKIINNLDPGYVSGLNVGVKEAQYDIIGFLSADCYPKKDWLEKLATTIETKNVAVVMGREEVCGDSDIHYVLQKTRNHSKRNKNITFFENSNIIYKKEILKKLLPFTGVGIKKGGEDTLLSIRYTEEGYHAMRSGGAVVMHSIYDSMSDFEFRTKQQGARLGEFFHHGWRYPRTYLNPFYWSIVEFLAYFRYFDTRFLRIAFLRLKYTLSGMMQEK
jgi:glycosyltransferase involved in cell wall biosynthesis